MIDLSSAQTLERRLKPLDVMLLCLSALSPAASVYIGGGVVLHMAGTGAALAFIGGGIIAFLLAFLVAELGAAFPRAGGAYPGLALTLGPWAGFVAMMISLIVNPAVLGLATLGLADYVTALVPQAPRLPLVVGALLLATLTALLNIRANAVITGVFLMLEMLALLILAGVALFHPVRPLSEALMHPVNLAADGIMRQVGPATIALAMVSGVYVCAGAAWAVFFGEELQDAKRQLGRVVAGAGLTAAVTIALPIILLVLAIVDLPAILAAQAPVAAFLRQMTGPAVATLVTAGVILAIFNNMIALALANGRLVYSAARDGIGPHPLNRLLLRTHPRHKSPWVAVLAASAIAGAFCALGERGILVFISGEVLTGLLIALAVYSGRRRSLTGTGELYRSPFFPVLPIVAVIVAIATIVADLMDADAGRPSMILLTALDGAVLLYYALVLRRRPGGWRTTTPSNERTLAT